MPKSIPSRIVNPQDMDWIILSWAIAGAYTPQMVCQTPDHKAVLRIVSMRGLPPFAIDGAERGPRVCGPTWSPPLLLRWRTAHLVVMRTLCQVTILDNVVGTARAHHM
jgi:hypothetical protein